MLPSGPFAEIAEVDAGEHDLFHTFKTEAGGVFDYILYIVATALATGHGNGAEGTVVIAAVLYFHESARAVVA